jgi:hypothetical protein
METIDIIEIRRTIGQWAQLNSGGVVAIWVVT